MKDFIITTIASDHPGFCYAKVTDVISLYYTKDTRLEVIVGRKGSIYYLLGTAIQTIAGAPSPVDILREEAFTDLQQVISSWSGRYALVTRSCIYNDALCMMRLFYWQNGTDFCVTNSLRYINDFSGSTNLRKSFSEGSLNYGNSIDYYPGPATIYEDVYSVMYKQYIEYSLGNGCLIQTMHSSNTDLEKATIEQLLELLDSYLNTYLQNIACEFKNVYIPLTGGLDSRTILSYAIKNGIKFKCYTCDKADIALYDKRIPRTICKRFHIPYVYIKKPFISKRRINLRQRIFDEHTSELVIDRDREYYTYCQIPNHKYTVVLGGGCWELLRGYYDNKIADDSEQNKSSNIDFSKLCNGCSPLVEELLKVYLNYIKLNKMERIHHYDRFYLEQRLGCWLSGIEQAWDLYDTIRLQPINAHNIIDVLLEMAFRNNREIQKEIISRNEPKLLEYPINRINISVYQAVKNRIKQLIYRVRKMKY